MTPLILQVKEMLSRNLEAWDIARRLHVNIDLVREAIRILDQFN